MGHVGPEPAERIGASRTKGYQADVTDASQVARAFDDAMRDFGPAVHCVVANAGINVPPSPLAQTDPATSAASSRSTSSARSTC